MFLVSAQKYSYWSDLKDVYSSYTVVLLLRRMFYVFLGWWYLSTKQMRELLGPQTKQ